MRKDRTIKKLEQQVQELEGKLEMEQARARGVAGAPSEEVAEARASEKRAWDQVDQLKAALGEAGMVWLGDVARLGLWGKPPAEAAGPRSARGAPRPTHPRGRTRKWARRMPCERRRQPPATGRS